MNKKNVLTILFIIVLIFINYSLTNYKFSSFVKVKGSAERFVTADKVFWKIEFTNTGNNIELLQEKNAKDIEIIKKFLIDNNIEFEDRDITLNNPNEEELKKWIKLSGLDVKKFFNTSGILYREMNLKDKLKEMNEEEMIKLLATDGKLIKRPLLVSEEGILVGFKEDSYKQII